MLSYDLRLAVRSLLRNPGFSLIVICTMAMGIGANVAGFIYLSYFLWPTVDAPNPGELVRVETGFEKLPGGFNSYPDTLDLQKENRVFQQYAGYRLFGSAIKDKERTVFAWGHAVTGDYFSLFGALPEKGRLIQPSDDRPNSEKVVVLNHLFWTQHFHADPSVIGKTLVLNGNHTYTVIGVTQRGFQGEGIGTEIYLPLATASRMLTGLDQRHRRNVPGMARLAPNTSIAEAQAALVPLAKHLDQLYPEEHPREFNVTAVTDALLWVDEDPVVRTAKILMAAVALLLILACANVANLLLARSQARKQEMAILAAIGAGRSHLARRLLIESLLLSLTGGLLGLVIGYLGKEMIEYYMLQGTPVESGSRGEASSIIINERVLGLYVFGISVLTGMLFGLAPITQTLRTNLVTALKSTASAGPGKRIFDMRKTLVIVQVALSLVLLLGAGLLVRTLSAAKNQKLGFETKNLLLTAVYMSPARSGDPSDSKAAYQDLLQRLRSLSGVESASLVHRVPLSGMVPVIEVQLPQRSEKQSIDVNVIAPAYFETLKIPVLKGRSFDERDTGERPGVVIVNQTAARKLWPDQDPVGQRVHIRNDDRNIESWEVIGVVADSRYGRIVGAIDPQLYFTFQQRYRQWMTFVIRASMPVASSVREVLRQNYPDMAVINLVPFSEQVRRSLMDQRMNADIATGFGFLGLLLAGTGIFSVMSYTVSRRKREFGVRIAVGASASDISRQVLKEAGRLIAIGVFVGLVAAAALTKIITSILYGIDSHDLLTFTVVPLALTAIALIAAWVPAHRASRVNPLAALREE